METSEQAAGRHYGYRRQAESLLQYLVFLDGNLMLKRQNMDEFQEILSDAEEVSTTVMHFREQFPQFHTMLRNYQNHFEQLHDVLYTYYKANLKDQEPRVID